MLSVYFTCVTSKSYVQKNLHALSPPAQINYFSAPGPSLATQCDCTKSASRAFERIVAVKSLRILCYSVEDGCSHGELSYTGIIEANGIMGQ